MTRPESFSFQWFMAACFLSSNYDGPTGCTKWVRAMNPGAGLEMWYKSTAWPPQHSTPLNIQRFGGRVGSARVNLSQCKVILLWLPGACVRAQTHKQFYQTAHGLLGKGICSASRSSGPARTAYKLYKDSILTYFRRSWEGKRSVWKPLISLLAPWPDGSLLGRMGRCKLNRAPRLHLPSPN